MGANLAFARGQGPKLVSPPGGEGREGEREEGGRLIRCCKVDFVF